MKIFIATDFRTIKYRDKIFLASQYYYIVKRYKEAFENVILCSRIVETDKINETEGLFLVNDLLEGFIGCNSISEFWQESIKFQMKKEIQKCDMCVGRFPSVPAFVGTAIAKKLNIKIYAEIMGDPWDAYWNHSIRGKIIAPYMYLNTKKYVKNADYTLYVTENFLQSRYPSKGLCIGLSDVKISPLEEHVLERKLKKFRNNSFNEITLMTTASVDVVTKGQQFVIQAIPKLNDYGVRVRYLLVGDGNPERLKKIAIKFGVEDQLIFTGAQTLDGVIRYLDKTDIYIQPSLQEGLPRSVVEAMSRGCVCIGAHTGGIPELLDKECVIEKKSSDSIYKSIINLLENNKMIEKAERNFRFSEKFVDYKLAEKRKIFYAKVQNDLTEKRK